MYVQIGLLNMSVQEVVHKICLFILFSVHMCLKKIILHNKDKYSCVYVNFWGRNIFFTLADSPIANFKDLLETTIPTQVNVWKGGGGVSSEHWITNNSNVSITGVYDKKISGKKYFFVIYNFLVSFIVGQIYIYITKTTTNSLRKESPEINHSAKISKSLIIVLGISF